MAVSEGGLTFLMEESPLFCVWLVLLGEVIPLVLISGLSVVWYEVILA